LSFTLAGYLYFEIEIHSVKAAFLQHPALLITNLRIAARIRRTTTRAENGEFWCSPHAKLPPFDDVANIRLSFTWATAPTADLKHASTTSGSTVYLLTLALRSTCICGRTKIILRTIEVDIENFARMILSDNGRAACCTAGCTSLQSGYDRRQTLSSIRRIYAKQTGRAN
jgi:hypothetical protein